MTIDEILKSITETIATLPDKIGLSKCAGFYLLYQATENLKKEIREERTKYETEIKALKERLKELEDGSNQ